MPTRSEAPKIQQHPQKRTNRTRQRRREEQPLSLHISSFEASLSESVRIGGIIVNGIGDLLLSKENVGVLECYGKSDDSGSGALGHRSGDDAAFLSVAELGIGTSIVYFLYKPLQEDNHEKINEVMSMLAYLYRCIGFVIGGIGVIISLFFPWWFGHLSTGLPLVYFAFY